MFGIAKSRVRFVHQVEFLQDLEDIAGMASCVQAAGPVTECM